MSRLCSTILLSAVIAAPLAPAIAQERPARPPRPPRVMVRTDSGAPSHWEVFSNRRARLGVSVNLRAKETDSVGAFINSVTPGGPAAKAGIKSGDVVTSLDGKSLLEAGTAAEQGQSAPGLRLTELAAKLEPNDTISIELRRGKDKKTVSLVTGDEPAFAMADGGPGNFTYRFNTDENGPGDTKMHGFTFQDGPENGMSRSFERMRMNKGPGEAFMMSFDSPLADLELAPMNEDLGKYFGVNDGVLVISVPDDSQLNLKPGDVILAVDGRAPTSPSHLLRILRSYDEGESIKIDVMRMKKKETVTAKIGGSGRSHDKVPSGEMQ
ncbi:MAG: PDZ domain-containing protein [Gemmatimonadota bacterium]